MAAPSRRSIQSGVALRFPPQSMERIGRPTREPIPDPDSHDLILWNVVDERPTPEAIESRIRARHAIVSYLATVG
jgi:hypothetical protein